jgi:hypothetical protein
MQRFQKKLLRCRLSNLEFSLALPSKKRKKKKKYMVPRLTNLRGNCVRNAISLRSITCTACFFAKKNLGKSSEGCSFASERLSAVTYSRSTRLASSGQFPGQLVEDTFVSQMA